MFYDAFSMIMYYLTNSYLFYSVFSKNIKNSRIIFSQHIYILHSSTTYLNLTTRLLIAMRFII